MKNGYIETTIKGYTVKIFKGYNGDEVFITRGETKIYSARVHKGEGLERAVVKITAL